MKKQNKKIKYVLKEKYKKIVKDVIFWSAMQLSMLYFYIICILIYYFNNMLLLAIHILLYIIFISIITYLVYKEK